MNYKIGRNPNVLASWKNKTTFQCMWFFCVCGNRSQMNIIIRGKSRTCMGRRDFLFTSFSVLHIVCPPMRRKTTQNATMKNEIIQGREPSVPWKAQVWQVFFNGTTSGFSQWEGRSYQPASCVVWDSNATGRISPHKTCCSSHHMQSIAMKNNLSLISKCAIFKPEQMVGYCKNPLLPEITIFQEDRDSPLPWSTQHLHLRMKHLKGKYTDFLCAF